MSTALNIVICVVIVIFGIGELIMLLSMSKEMEDIHDKFDEINETKNLYNETVEGSGDIVTQGYSVKKINQALLEDTRDKYYQKYARYVVLSQLIALFPLLGILGTVWGLVLSGGSGVDVTEMMNGLGMALWTTLVGLVCSIILKFVDATMVGKKVNLIDAKFEQADSIIDRQLIKSEIKAAVNRI